LLYARALIRPRVVRAADDAPLWVFVGTYTRGTASAGIYRMELDPATGGLSEPVPAAKAVNPSFLAVHPSKRFLYAVGEIGDFDGGRAGAVASFALDPAKGSLAFLNVEPSGGADPCHLTVGAEGLNVLVANYSGGSVAVLPIAPDGSLRPISCKFQHKGQGVDPGRQKGPHAHSINLDPTNRFAVAADLGLDRLFVYRYRSHEHTLEAAEPPFTAAAPGSGPRHFAFHPDGKHAFAINELNSTMTAYDYDPASGRLTPIQTLSTLPDGFTGKSYCAEVVVHPSGRFVYGSNRGDDSLAVFGFDPATGKLTPITHVKTGGKAPRNFAIEPTGRWLLAANQDSDSVVVFRIDPETGVPTATGASVSIPKPVCVRFVGGAIGSP
jgi:6-phosphogluconolactonase